MFVFHILSLSEDFLGSKKELEQHRATPSTQKMVLPSHLQKESLETMRWIRRHYRIEGVSCVDWSNTHDWHLPSRKVWDSFFLLVVWGEIEVNTMGNIWRVGPGQVICLPDGTEHQIRSTNGALRQLAFHAHIVNEIGESLLQRFAEPVVSLSRSESFVDSLRRCAQWMVEDPPIGRERLEQILWQFLQELLESGLKVERGIAELDSRVERAMNLLRKNLVHDWSIPEIARAVGLGSARFRALFVQALGVGPKSWLMNKRMERGAELLLSERTPVVDISRSMGYKDEHHFQRSFKRWSGMTPTEFRLKKHL